MAGNIAKLPDWLRIAARTIRSRIKIIRSEMLLPPLHLEIDIQCIESVVRRVYSAEDLQHADARGTQRGRCAGAN
jgi:hypothetical protein